jgi:DnaJ family protein C protein 13
MMMQQQVIDYKPFFENVYFHLFLDDYNASEFFNDLYHRFLLSQPTNPKQSSMKSMCLQAMTIVYARHYESIGPFNDTRHIILMLDRSTDKCERDRLLMFISKLISNHRNVRDIIDCNGIKTLIQLMCLAHLHINRAHVPLASNVLESSTTMTRENEKEWYYGKQDKEKVGPYSFNEIKDLHKEGNFDAKTRFWAQGNVDRSIKSDFVLVKNERLRMRIHPTVLKFSMISNQGG